MKIWDKYEKANRFLEDTQTIDYHNWFWDMYLGNQWKGAKLQAEKPVINFVKQIIDYKIAAIGQNQMTAIYSDNDPRNDETYVKLNREFKNRWQKEDMDEKIYEMLRTSAILGDSFIYFGKKDDSRLIPPSNILVADEQIHDIQSQKYIMIRFSEDVDKVKEEALANGLSEDEIALILPDDNSQYEVGSKRTTVRSELSKNKTTVVYYFEKKDGVVYFAKANKYCEYEPLHPLEMTSADGEILHAAQYYPIARLCCTKIPTSFRSRGWVEDLIPNQIEYNKTQTRMSQSIRITAFPKLAYNADTITNPEDLDVVGKPIEVEGNAQSVGQAIAYLQPMSMSGDAFQFANILLQTTKMVSGASDAITGVSDPTRVSGTAVIEIREQATLALKGNVIAMKKLYQDIAKIKLDLWQTYYPNGIEVNRPLSEEERVMLLDGEDVAMTDHITGEELRSLSPDVVIDVTLRTETTKQYMQNIIDQKLNEGHISFDEWVEISDDLIPKDKFIKILQMRKANNTQQGVPME